jgi:hypothetical protein
MAELGTVGTALAKSPPPPPATTTPAADPAPDDSSQSPDVPGLRDVVNDNRSTTKALLGRLKEIDTRSDAMQPPVMQQAPKPPETQNTPIAERWGSIAMMLAGFGGLLTRQPLTASLNAMAAVNHAYNEGDAATAKSAFDTWKVENENAIKMNEFQVRAYDAAIKKYSSDRAGALGEIRANAAALKDDVVIQLLDSGQEDRALAVLGARSAATDLLGDHTQKITDQRNAMDYWDRANPNANPTQRGLAHAAIRIGHDPDDTSKEYGKGAPTQLQVTGADGKPQLIYADRDNKTGGWVTADENRTPIHADASGGFRIMPKTEKTPTVSGMDAAEIKKLTDGGMPYEEAKRKVLDKPISAPDQASQADRTRAGIEFRAQTGYDYDPATASDDDKLAYLDKLNAAAKTRKDASGPTKTLGVPAQELADTKKDLRVQHPDWTEGQLDMAANKQITESKQPVMSDEAADLNARVALKTGHAPTTMGRSQANIAKFQDAYATEAKAQGMGADEIAANMVKFTGEMSEGRALGTTSARVDFAANELDVALPQALELSQNVYRPGWKKASQIEQALQGQTNDPDLIEFAQQNQAVMNAYALAMQRGGLSTVAGMDRAEHMLSTATSQPAYMRQLDRLHKEVQTILYGTAAAKQHLVNEITGGTTQVPQPTLTNVPRPGQDTAGGGALPPAARASLREGHVTTFANNQSWTLRNGKPEQVTNAR